MDDIRAISACKICEDTTGEYNFGIYVKDGLIVCSDCEKPITSPLGIVAIGQEWY